MPDKKKRTKKDKKDKKDKSKTKISNNNIINIKVGGGRRNNKNPLNKKGLVNPYSNIAIPMTTNRPQYLDPTSATQREAIVAAVPTFTPVSHVPTSSNLSPTVKTEPPTTPLSRVQNVPPPSRQTLPSIFKSPPIPPAFHPTSTPSTFQPPPMPVDFDLPDSTDVKQMLEQQKKLKEKMAYLRLTPIQVDTLKGKEVYLPSTPTLDDFGSESSTTSDLGFKLNPAVRDKWETLVHKTLKKEHEKNIKIEKVRKQKRDWAERNKDNIRIQKLIKQGIL
jgi:hypothetical protein